MHRHKELRQIGKTSLPMHSFIADLFVAKRKPMGCTAIAWLLTGPRLALLAWRFVSPAYVGMAFNSAFWGFVGWLLTPWTSLFYIHLYPGGVIGAEWLFLGVGLVADAATYYGIYLNGPVIYIVEVTPINAEDDSQQ